MVMKPEHDVYQTQIDALQKELYELKQIMLNFISMCELNPDGPVAQEIIEKTEEALGVEKK